MPKILIPTPLRQYTGKQDTVQVKGATVGEALSDLTTQHQDLRRNIYNDEGKLRSFVNVYLNDEDIRYLSKEATPVKEGDTISIVPSIAGGSALRRWRRQATLSKDEILRYSRHLIMPEVGMEGQLKLKSAKVLLIGAGGLGAPLGLYLAAAGVGRIGLVDFDVVDFTNLQRQVIHGTKDVGRKKLDSAADSMQDINPFVKIDRHEVRHHQRERVRHHQGLRHRGGRHRQLPHALPGERRLRAAGQAERLRVDLPVRRARRRSSPIRAGPCYRCLYPEPPPPGLVPSCAEGGVLGILPGTIG